MINQNSEVYGMFPSEIGWSSIALAILGQSLGEAEFNQLSIDESLRLGIGSLPLGIRRIVRIYRTTLSKLVDSIVHHNVAFAHLLQLVRGAWDSNYVHNTIALPENSQRFNKETWQRHDLVKLYSKQSELQPAEGSVLSLLSDRLPQMKMLDIGVGGGRTTIHFGERVKEYVGIDYSQEMIDATKHRFADHSGNISFELCDATSMDLFAANTFDFILFSFNGIDCLSHDDRLKVLSEIRRVGKASGYFCFSTHNLQNVPKLFRLRLRQVLYLLRTRPSKAKALVRRWFLLRFVYNKYLTIKQLTDLPYVVCNDGAHNFGLSMYYIKPTKQLEQLRNMFTDVRVFSLETGAEIEDKTTLDTLQGPWLYYLCTIK